MLFVGRHEPRKGVLDLLKAHRILRKTGCDCRLLVVGSGPQEREARRYVATRGLRASSSSGASATPRRPSSSRRPTSTPRRPPAASRSASCCSRRWPRDTDRVLRHPRLQGRRAPRPRGLLVPPREPRELAIAIDRLLRDPELARQMGAAGQARAQEFSWPRVTAKVEDYYGFVIRRLAATGTAARGLPGAGASGAATAAGEALGRVPI